MSPPIPIGAALRQGQHGGIDQVEVGLEVVDPDEQEKPEIQVA